MTRKKKKRPDQPENLKPISDLISRHGFTLSIALLFSTTFIYLFWFGRSLFFYQLNRSLFVYTSDYFQKFTVRPGGLLSYFASFLTQIYGSPFCGSLLLSLLLVLSAFIFRDLIKRICKECSLTLLWTIVPSLVMITGFTNTDFGLQHLTGSILAVIWFKAMALSGSSTIKRIFLCLFPLYYYFAGSYAIITFGMYITFNLSFVKGSDKYLNILIITFIAFLTYILSAKALFLQPAKILIGNPLIFNESFGLSVFLILNGIFYIFYPLIIRISGSAGSVRLSSAIPAATLLFIFPLMVFLFSVLNKPETSKVRRIEEMFQDREWDKIIFQHEKDPSGSIVELFYYNLALNEKDQLCERMFFGNQSSGPMALSLEGNREQAFRTMHYYYSVGLVNEARHLAYELMVQDGYTPENIKMLIRTELINGNFRVAKRYLNVLDKTILYKKESGKYMKMLADKELVKSDPELGEKIRLMPRQDFFIHTDDARNIDLLLKSNPENKKAFEYRMARLLLEKDIMAVADEVKKMKEAGYSRIPRHIQEAVIMYESYTGESPDLGGLFLEKDTERRFADYLKIVNSYKKDKLLLEKNIKKTERNTFWYYLQFGTIRRDFTRGESPDRSIY